jgi:YidC/Oxa1 family membrane protein insertase
MLNNNNDQDMQKRLFIAVAVAGVLLVIYSVVSTYFFAPEQKSVKQELNTTEQTTSVNNNSPTKETQGEANNQKEINSNYKPSGNFNLLLGSKRINSDNLKDIVKVKTNFGYIEISKVGGRIVSIYVDRFKTDIISDFSKKNRIFPTEIITTDPKITELINFSKYDFKKDGNKLIFTFKNGNIEVQKTYIVNKNSTLEFNLKTKGLENYGLAIINGVVLNSEANSTFGHSGAIIKTKTELIKIDPDIETEKIIRGDILWAGEENKYFIQLLASKNGFTATHIIPIAEEKTLVISEIPTNIEASFFFGGPKLYSLLGEINDYYKQKWGVNLDLRDSIDFGFFGFLGKPMFIVMHWLYNYIHNWGLTIIVLTILLRILLFPLNHYSIKSMKKMSQLAPEIQKLQKKYKDDPQKLQEEMMKLYAKYGTNPFSGCLPILLQIPIFIALYNVLLVTVELKMVPFLWIPDLSEKDPYYILPILMGLSMIAQQWITPASDKNQKIMMYIMAAVFTFLFMNFPAGLVLYWLTNNVLGILQSFIVHKQMEKENKG